MQFKAIEQFKERLEKEGVIDETEDIARAKRLPWVGDEAINQQLALASDFAKIVRIEGRTYAIHRETLNKLYEKLPIKDEELHQLTEAERRILQMADKAGIIIREEPGVWRKTKNETASSTY